MFLLPIDDHSKSKPEENVEEPFVELVNEISDPQESIDAIQPEESNESQEIPIDISEDVSEPLKVSDEDQDSTEPVIKSFKPSESDDESQNLSTVSNEAEEMSEPAAKLKEASKDCLAIEQPTDPMIQEASETPIENTMETESVDQHEDLAVTLASESDSTIEQNSDLIENAKVANKVEIIADSNACPKCGKIYDSRFTRWLLQHISKCDGVNPDTKKDAMSKEAPKKRKSKVIKELSEISKEEIKVPGDEQVEQNIELNDINTKEKSRKRKRTAPELSVKVTEEYDVVENESNETSRVENESNTCPKCGKIYPNRAIRFLPGHISKCKARKLTNLNISGQTTSLEDALTNSASILDSNPQPDADSPNVTSKDDSKVDKVPVRETTSLKSKFESVNNDDGEFEQHLTNLIEDLNDTQNDVQGTPIEGSKTKDWSNVCGTCGKKFKYPSRMKTHQRLKGCKGNLKLNFPYWREVV